MIIFIVILIVFFFQPPVMPEEHVGILDVHKSKHDKDSKSVVEVVDEV